MNLRQDDDDSTGRKNVTLQLHSERVISKELNEKNYVDRSWSFILDSESISRMGR